MKNFLSKPSAVTQKMICADYEALRLAIRKEAKAELRAAFREIDRKGAPKLQRWNRAGQELRVFK